MKRFLAVLLIFSLLFCGNFLSVGADAFDENYILVKAYSPYRSGKNLSLSTNPSGYTTQSEFYKGEALGAWCGSAAIFTSGSTETVSTELYTDFVTDTWCNIKISPQTDTFMLYVELPEFSADTCALRMLYPCLAQGSTNFWINPYNSKYTYFDVYTGVWRSATVGPKGELNALGSGFKGYVKFDLKDFYNYNSHPAGFDFDKDYTISIMQIGYNHVGGDNGELKIGSYYSILKDGEYSLIKNTDTGETLSMQAINGDFDINGKLDSVDITLARKLILEKLYVTQQQAIRSDITGFDNELNITDLVKLKKLTLGINDERIIEFKGSTYEKDNFILDQNPDRGFRFQSFVNLNHTDDNKLLLNMWQYYPKFETAAEKVKGGIWVDPNLNKVYFFLTDYKDSETLPESYFKNMQTVIDKAVSMGQKIIIRFLYQEGMGTNPETNTPYYEQQASQEIMYAHMKQLAPFLEKNKKKISFIEAGFLGAFGEWHSYYQSFYGDQNRTDGVMDAKKAWDNSTEIDEIELIKAILEMVPDELYVLLRCSDYRDMFLEKYPNEKYACRLGLKNDAFFGYKNELNAWPYHSMTNKSSLSAVKASRVAPMSGEFFWGAEWPTGRVTGEEGILAFKYFHQNTFSIYHNSFEGTSDVAGTPPYTLWHYTEREGDMSIWARTEMSADWLTNNNVFYSPTWFCDKNGNAVSRSQYEFVRDHLGYRLALKKLKISGAEVSGRTLNTSIELVNYGFSAAFNLISKLVILDENENIVSSVKAGNPTEWQNTCALETHKINAKIKLPQAKGSYKLALYIHNTAGTGAYLANEIEHTNGFNIIYNFEI